MPRKNRRSTNTRNQRPQPAAEAGTPPNTESTDIADPTETAEESIAGTETQPTIESDATTDHNREGIPTQGGTPEKNERSQSNDEIDSVELDETPTLEEPTETQPETMNAEDIPGSDTDTRPTETDGSANKIDGIALTSLALGILSFFAPILAGIPAILTGVTSLNRIKTNGRAGRGIALTGLALGAATTTFMFLLGFGATVYTLSHDTKTQQEQDFGRQASAATQSSAETFADTLLARAATGTALPITLQDAEEVYRNTPSLTKGVDLKDWRKKPGTPQACFTVVGPDAANSSIVITADEFGLGRAVGSYRALPDSETCAKVASSWPSKP